MKNTNQTIEETIIDLLRGTGTIHSITITDDCEGFETCIIKDQTFGDMSIIQSIADEVTVTHLDNNEIEALKAILL